MHCIKTRKKLEVSIKTIDRQLSMIEGLNVNQLMRKNGRTLIRLSDEMKLLRERLELYKRSVIIQPHSHTQTEINSDMNSIEEKIAGLFYRLKQVTVLVEMKTNQKKSSLKEVKLHKHAMVNGYFKKAPQTRGYFIDKMK